MAAKCRSLGGVFFKHNIGMARRAIIDGINQL